MTNPPDLMNLAFAAARHAATRQDVIAQNIANADTPGFRARDTGRFDDVYRDGSGAPMRATRDGHLTGSGTEDGSAWIRRSTGIISPNGNSVSIEQEMVRSVEAQRDHSEALAIWRASLDLLRASLGRR